MTSMAMAIQEYFLTSMADNKLQTLSNPPKDGTPARPDYKDVAYAQGRDRAPPLHG